MNPLQRPALQTVDAEAVLAEARRLIGRKIEQPARRAFLTRSLTLGGLSLLTGCGVSDHEGVEAALGAISRFNDKDVVRHALVGRIVRAYEADTAKRLEEQQGGHKA